MKSIITYSLVAFLLGSHTSTIGAEEQVHVDWLSSANYADDDALFVAATLAESHPGLGLALAMAPGDCSASVLLGFRTDSKYTFGPLMDQIYLGQWRVDERPVRAVSFEFYDRGVPKWIYLAITGFEDPRAAYRDVIEGRKLRLKLVIRDDTIYVRFSLRGSRAALSRAKIQCLRYTRSQSHQPRYGDEQYFRGSEGQGIRADEEYFR